MKADAMQAASIEAAELSAQAASFSAIAACLTIITAFIIIYIQYHSLLESIRPEVVLGNLIRPNQHTISIDLVENIGKGAALDVSLNCHHSPGININSPKHIAVLANGYAEDKLGVNFSFNWDDIVSKVNADNYKFTKFEIHISYADCRDNKYLTKYYFDVSQNLYLTNPEDVTDGVRLLNRDVSRENAYYIKAKKKFSDWFCS